MITDAECNSLDRGLILLRNIVIAGVLVLGLFIVVMAFSTERIDVALISVCALASLVPWYISIQVARAIVRIAAGTSVTDHPTPITTTGAPPQRAALPDPFEIYRAGKKAE